MMESLAQVDFAAFSSPYGQDAGLDSIHPAQAHRQAAFI
jgi:hypothetical protein